MFSLPMLLSLVALGVAGGAVYWAVLSALVARRAQDELRANRLELVHWQQQAADQEAARITAVQLVDDLTVQRREEIQALMARLQALQHQYEVTLRLYQDSVAIDGPLASRRLQ